MYIYTHIHIHLYIYIICIYIHVHTNHKSLKNYIFYKQFLFDNTAKMLLPERAKRAEVSSKIHMFICIQMLADTHVHKNLATCTYARRHTRNSRSAAIHTCTHINTQAHACIHKDIQVKTPHIYMLSHFLRASRSFAKTGGFPLQTLFRTFFASFS